MGQQSIMPVGDTGVKIQFHEIVNQSLNHKIRLFCQQLADKPFSGMVEWVPAFDSVTVYYRPTILSFSEVKKKLQQITIDDTQQSEVASRTIYVPVIYGGKYGPDLQRVAEHNQLAEQDVIGLHQQSECLIYMLGFLPGFPYLGGMDERIATPRLDQPRGRIEAGAVGIAGSQTGIYPMVSPGGWNIIGKTPVRLCDWNQPEDAFLFRLGDVVQFYQVSAQTYAEIEERQAKGTFSVEEKWDA